MDSQLRDVITREKIPQVLPSKNRCGSNDPIQMGEDSKCTCQTKEGLGADEGVWITMEVLNIPWDDGFLDLASQTFLNAKYVVEKAVSRKVHMHFLVNINFPIAVKRERH